MAAAHGTKIKFLKQQLEISERDLYRVTHRLRTDPTIVNAIKENISNIKKDIEQFERRDYFEDTGHHQMPPPPPPQQN